MHGNVWVFCQDWYREYLDGIAVDPQGPATGEFRVIRGGGWDWNGLCRAAIRGVYAPGYWRMGFGFRTVLAPGQP